MLLIIKFLECFQTHPKSQSVWIFFFLERTSTPWIETVQRIETILAEYHFFLPFSPQIFVAVDCRFWFRWKKSEKKIVADMISYTLPPNQRAKRTSNPSLYGTDRTNCIGGPSKHYSWKCRLFVNLGYLEFLAFCICDHKTT